MRHSSHPFSAALADAQSFDLFIRKLDAFEVRENRQLFYGGLRLLLLFADRNYRKYRGEGIPLNVRFQDYIVCRLIIVPGDPPRTQRGGQGTGGDELYLRGSAFSLPTDHAAGFRYLTALSKMEKLPVSVRSSGVELVRHNQYVWLQEDQPPVDKYSLLIIPQVAALGVSVSCVTVMRPVDCPAESGAFPAILGNIEILVVNNDCIVGRWVLEFPPGRPVDIGKPPAVRENIFSICR